MDLLSHSNYITYYIHSHQWIWRKCNCTYIYANEINPLKSNECIHKWDTEMCSNIPPWELKKVSLRIRLESMMLNVWCIGSKKAPLFSWQQQHMALFNIYYMNVAQLVVGVSCGFSYDFIKFEYAAFVPLTHLQKPQAPNLYEDKTGFHISFHL